MKKIQLEWENIGRLLEEAAEKNADKPLIIYEGSQINFADANRRTNRIANVFKQLGLQKGERVSVMLSNCIEFPLIWLAIGKSGLVSVPTNTEYQEHDLEFILNNSGAVCMIIHSDFLPVFNRIKEKLTTLKHILVVGDEVDKAYKSFLQLVEQASDEYEIGDVGETDLLNIQYTSGTTGFPKGCMLNHRHWMLMGCFAKEALDIRSDDVHFNAQPFYYGDGQWNLILCLMGGVSLVLVPRFSVSRFWQTVVDNSVTFFYCLGTMPAMLSTREPDELEKNHKLRAVSCSGIIPQMHKTYEERFNVPWREGYGTTESGTDIFADYKDLECVGTGTLGKPVPSKEVKIVDNDGKEIPTGDVGELLVRGEPMMLGYWNNQEATNEVFKDGWFHSGDLFRRDEKGYYYLVGRVKDMIRRGGENVSAAEVEGVLMEHEKINLAAIIPVPDPVREEEVKAYIVLAEGETVETVPPADIIIFAKSKLAAFKVPRYIEYMESLPLTPSERIEKMKLRTAKDDLRTGSYDASVERWITV